MVRYRLVRIIVGIYLSTNVDESGIIHAEKPNSMQQIREAR